MRRLLAGGKKVRVHLSFIMLLHFRFHVRTEWKVSYSLSFILHKIIFQWDIKETEKTVESHCCMLVSFKATCSDLKYLSAPLTGLGII